MNCGQCGHPEDKHFICSIGSFCSLCSTQDNIWEHSFDADSPEESPRELLRRLAKAIDRAILYDSGPCHHGTREGYEWYGRSPEVWENVREVLADVRRRIG